MIDFPRQIELVEVGPRDGLQSLEKPYPTEVKVEMIERLVQAGLRTIEVTSFVRPDIVPQLADAEEVMARLSRVDGCIYRALVPNRLGAERAAASGVGELLGLITASEAYNRKNSNMSVDENLVALEEIAEVGQRERIPVVVALGVCMFSPYEGDLPTERVIEMIERMRGFGIDSVYVATSVGVEGPRQVHSLCSAVKDRFPDLRLGLHLHNTNGMALANAMAAMDAGVEWLEGAICGIGGGIRMPYGMPHFGNVPTEDLAQLCEESHIGFGTSFEAVLDAARDIRALLGLEGTPLSFSAGGGTKQNVLKLGRTAPRH